MSAIEKPRPAAAPIGTRVFVTQIGRFGTVAAHRAGFGCTRLVVDLDEGGWIDVPDYGVAGG